MSFKVRQSPYNPVTFYERDYVRSTGINYVHPRRAMDGYNLEPQDPEKPFYQPFCTSDTICLQFKRGYAGTAAWNYAILRFYDKDGNYIDYINPTHTYTLTGDVDEFGEQLYAIQWCFKPSDYAFLNNHEYISLNAQFHYGDGSAINVGDTVYNLTSHALHIKASHEDTGLVKYSRNRNTYDGTYFEFPDIFPRFMIRVPAGRVKTIAAGVYTVFNDQRQRQEVLHAESFNKYTWDVYDVPVRILDTLNYALKSENVQIDDSEYVLDPDGTEEDSSGAPRQSRTYGLTDKDREETLDFDKVLVLMWEEASYPYGITGCHLWNDYDLMFKPPWAFQNSAGVDAYISDFETQKTSVGATGEFIRDSGKVYYRNGPGETFRIGELFGLVKVKPKALTVTFNVSDVNFPAGLSFRALGANGSVSLLMRETADTGAATIYYNDAGFVNISKSYGSTGTKTFIVFHNDDPTELYASSPGSYPKVTDITGNVPSVLQKFEMVGADLSAHATFSLTFLQAAKDKLRTLILRSCQIEGITANWASSLVSGTYKPFFLQYIDIRSNSFSVTNLDAFINEIYNSCAWQAGPYTGLAQGQSPLAAPSASAAAITDMETNYQWDWQHD